MSLKHTVSCLFRSPLHELLVFKFVCAARYGLTLGITFKSKIVYPFRTNCTMCRTVCKKRFVFLKSVSILISGLILIIRIISLKTSKGFKELAAHRLKNEQVVSPTPPTDAYCSNQGIEDFIPHISILYYSQSNAT